MTYQVSFSFSNFCQVFSASRISKNHHAIELCSVSIFSQKSDKHKPMIMIYQSYGRPFATRAPSVGPKNELVVPGISKTLEVPENIRFSLSNNELVVPSTSSPLLDPKFLPNPLYWLESTTNPGNRRSNLQKSSWDQRNCHENMRNILESSRYILRISAFWKVVFAIKSVKFEY